MFSAITLDGMQEKTGGSGNRLLDVFLRESPAIQSAMQPVEYESGHVVYRQDKPISHAYFPGERLDVARDPHARRW
jgi:hypothetical protein